MAGQHVDFESRWNQLVARAGIDDAFKQRLLADPAGVLKEQGLTLPAGVTVKVLDNTGTVVHLVLPQKPAPAELSEEDLRTVAGGNLPGLWRLSRVRGLPQVQGLNPLRRRGLVAVAYRFADAPCHATAARWRVRRAEATTGRLQAVGREGGARAAGEGGAFSVPAADAEPRPLRTGPARCHTRGGRDQPRPDRSRRPGRTARPG
jgi:hypothetical protein